MPLSIDSVNNVFYTSRPLNGLNNGQTDQVQRVPSTSGLLAERAEEQAQERLQQRQQIEQNRQDQLREAREQRLQQGELQLRQEREEAARALDEQRLETLQNQRQDYLNPLSPENLARQRTQLEVTPPALATQTQVSPRLAAEAIATYRQTEAPDVVSRGLVV